MGRPGEGVGSPLFVTAHCYRPTQANCGATRVSPPPFIYLYSCEYILSQTHCWSLTKLLSKTATTRSLDGLSPKFEKLLNSVWLSSGTVPPGQQFNCLSADSALAHSHQCLSTLFSETHACQKPYSLQMNTSGSRNGMSFTSGGWLTLPSK